jgi:hypothetical protein
MMYLRFKMRRLYRLVSSAKPCGRHAIEMYWARITSNRPWPVSQMAFEFTSEVLATWLGALRDRWNSPASGSAFELIGLQLRGTIVQGHGGLVGG